MDATERALFEQSLRRAVDTHSGPGLDAALAELGWHEALAAEPATAISSLFELQGAANAASGALDDVLLDALGTRGAAGVAVVLPELDDWDPPGDQSDDGGSLAVRGIGTARLMEADTALVVATSGTGTIAAVVKSADLVRRSVAGLDPALGLVAVAGTVRTAGDRLPADAWPEAVGRAQLALGHELVGATGAMVELARRHALEREQFDRPIAAFQAVRHRLADTLVAMEGARALLGAAWEERTPRAAAMAKAMAGQAARTAARHCQQVLAGMGFTTEHPLHRHVRRVLVLDELLGSSRTLTRSLGRELIDSRTLPEPLPL
jgi:hypothetical protein